MGNSESQLVLLSIDKLESLLNPVLNKLAAIEKNLNKKTTTSKRGYYRNKDLKQIFGLSNNTILKYREKGILPYTYLDNIYYYPKDELDEVLQRNSNSELFKIAS